MKVAYFTHPSAFNIFGGAEIQILKTKEYIGKANQNIDVKFFNIFEDKLDDFDIFHNFKMHNDCITISKLAQNKGVNVVLSPIYWPPLKEQTRFVEREFTKMENLLDNLRAYRALSFKQLIPFKNFLEISSLILPNSQMEADTLSNAYYVASNKFHVVPNGVEKRFAEAKPDLFVEKYGLKDFILFVGRLEPRKNVLSLLMACKDINVPLVIIGQESNLEQDYCSKLKKLIESNKNFHYLGFLPSDSDELASAYAAAKVFVLPSWFETPGLSALEAGLAGCNIVITQGGSTKEYFRDMVWYVDPTSIENIRSQIKRALDEPKNDRLKQLLLNNFTWDVVASKTIEAYKRLLSN
jgi:glycosyltransferase involved in cell wall biosynthesis